MYQAWGFDANPFQTIALEPTALGERLLIGRDQELAALQRRLTNPPRLPTLEGMNGVGKSSLVNVAAYKCFCDFLENPDKPLLIPCRKIFQLRPEQALEQFINEVYMEVAQTLVEAAKKIDGPRFEHTSAGQQVDKWLNSAQLSSFQAGIGPLSGGKTSETNTGEGFTKSGFRNAVRDWLEDIFPEFNSGGVVCVIDNLGSFAPSDFEHFQFNSIAAFRPHVRDLEAAGLVVSTQDDGDKRRKTIQVTSKGWLVNEYLRNKA